jgi:hypothetical protein
MENVDGLVQSACGFKWLSRALDVITKPQYILTVVDEGISGKFSST